MARVAAGDRAAADERRDQRRDANASEMDRFPVHGAVQTDRSAKSAPGLTDVSYIFAYEEGIYLNAANCL
jgi:hypothetical protein